MEPTHADLKPYRPLIRDLPQDERPRERLTQVGPQALSTSELLAILLRTGSGRESSLRLAERILRRFDNLSGLGRATLEDLKGIRGVGPAKATEIQAAFELGRRLSIATPAEKVRIHSPADAAALVQYEMSLLEQEHLRVILLDTRNQVGRIETIYIGSLNSAVVRVGELFRPAIRYNAAAVILVHNHPSGDPSPSSEDVRVTREVVKAGKLLDIMVLDHLIIGRGRFVSLKERGLGFSDE